MAWDPGANVTIFACPCEWVPESAFVWVPELVPENLTGTVNQSGGPARP